MDRKLILLIILSSFLLLGKRPHSEVLIFDLSEKEIEVSKNKSNPDFTIFGFTNSKSSLVLKIRGPSQKVFLQKKKKIMGMWSWSKTGEFVYPGLFHYYTNKDDDEIDFEVKKDLFDNVKLIGKDDDNLKKDLIEKGKSEDEIYDFLSEKYGDWILYNPKFNLANILLWGLPYSVLIIGGIIIVFLIRKQSKKA